MAIVKPFQAARPHPDYVEQVTILPRGYLDRDEAVAIAAGNPYTFLHIDKAEIDLELPIESEEPVARKARENLERFFEQEIFAIDTEPCYYLYQLEREGRKQIGVVGCSSIDDYMDGVIKKHEYTRADKEAGCAAYINTVNVNTSPIYLACRPSEALNQVALTWTTSHAPVYDFTAADGVRHSVWVVDTPQTMAEIERIFRDMDSLYIADGHHRCAAAVRVGQMRRETHPGYAGDEEFNYMLAVIFPADQLQILEYNRVAKDLNGYTPAQFIERLRVSFEVERMGKTPVRPAHKHEMGMLLDGDWYRITARPGSFRADDPVLDLDVSILQENVLVPILGIRDSRTDPRLMFAGGLQEPGELEGWVRKGWELAFTLYPTDLDDLMTIADNGKVMPPKSTWFEPKLRTGLFLHRLDG